VPVSALHALLRMLLVSTGMMYSVHLGHSRGTVCCMPLQEARSSPYATWPSTRAPQLLQACSCALGVVVVGEVGPQGVGQSGEWGRVCGSSREWGREQEWRAR
jgi:hypothetical protein